MAEATPSDTPICPTCGIVALPRRLACGMCQSPITLTLAPARADGGYWARVECEFECRGCAAMVPLNHLEVDSGVRCARCGLDQPIDRAVWTTALQYAQGVADLSGPNPEGRDSALNAARLSIAATNPCAAIGVTKSHVEETFRGELALHVTVSPGHPLCARCNTPIELTVEAPEHGGRTSSTDEYSATSRCPGCHERAIFGLPDAARALCPSLSAVVATEHRIDRVLVASDPMESSRPLAIRCPSCAAPVVAEGDSRFVTCGACKTSARIPERTWLRMLPSPPKPEPMWLLFRGPSAMRQKLLERAQIARAGEDAVRTAALEGDRARHVNVVKAKKDTRRVRVRGLVVFALVIAIVGGLAWGIPFFFPYQRPDPTNACTISLWKLCDDQGVALEKLDPATAKRRFAAACKGGYAPACTHDARLEEDRGEAPLAAKQYARGCSGGDALGCARLGSLSERAPFGVPRDYARAIALYKQACDAGEPLGCLGLASMTESGRGIPANDAQAASLYEKACAAREKTACWTLSLRYAAGRGVKKDDAKATALRHQACDLGHLVSCE